MARYGVVLRELDAREVCGTSDVGTPSRTRNVYMPLNTRRTLCHHRGASANPSSLKSSENQGKSDR